MSAHGESPLVEASHLASDGEEAIAAPLQHMGYTNLDFDRAAQR